LIYHPTTNHTQKPLVTNQPLHAKSVTQLTANHLPPNRMKPSTLPDAKLPFSPHNLAQKPPHEQNPQKSSVSPHFLQKSSGELRAKGVW